MHAAHAWKNFIDTDNEVLQILPLHVQSRTVTARAGSCWQRALLAKVAGYAAKKRARVAKATAAVKRKAGFAAAAAKKTSYYVRFT